jgi:hypothetical protein
MEIKLFNLKRLGLIALAFLLATVLGATSLLAATLGNVKVTLTNQNASATSVGYSFVINPTTTATTIKGVKVVFGTTEGGSTVPTSMSTTGAAFGTTSLGGGAWTAGSFTTNGTMSFTNSTGSTPTNPVSFNFTGITNSNTNGTYFAQITTYSDTGLASPIDQDDVAFVIAPSTVTVTGSVNETLTFSLSATSVSLGTLSTGAVGTGTGNLTVATNAANGYGVNVSGSTLTRGTDTIPFVTSGTAVAAGTAGYGLRVSSCAAGASCSSTQDIGSTLTAGVTDLISRTSTTTGDTSTIQYRASINSTSPAGAYSSSISYVAVGKF